MTDVDILGIPEAVVATAGIIAVAAAAFRKRWRLWSWRRKCAEVDRANATTVICPMGHDTGLSPHPRLIWSGMGPDRCPECSSVVKVPSHQQKPRRP